MEINEDEEFEFLMENACPFCLSPDIEKIEPKNPYEL